MRYQPDEPRCDDPEGVMKHAGRFDGGKALVVLGGYSAVHWAELYASVQPDVVIIANGVNALVANADYWICAENMTRSNRLAQEGDKSSREYMEMFHRDAGAKTKLVSWHSWGLLRDTSNCISVRRQGLELDEMDGFSFRDYGMGYLAGWLLKDKAAGAAVHVGTVGAQCLHHAGILGCAEVHTIGYDLMFRNEGGGGHHAYKYPAYAVDRYRNPGMFVEYEGVRTQRVWIETAEWLKAIEHLFKRDGLRWTDHSGGLLKLAGLECAGR